MKIEKIQFCSKFREKAFLVSSIYLPVFILLGFISIQNKVPVPLLLRDVFSSADIPSYTGLISNMGIFLWAVSGSICCFSYFVFLNKSKRILCFLLYGTGLSFLMMLDDGLLLHERFFQNYFHISEELVLMIYGCLVLLFLISCRRIIGQSDFIFLVLAIFFFALSINFDLAFPTEEIHNQIPFLMLLEDGSKLLGIVSWSSYFVGFSFREIHQLIATPQG